MKRTEMVEKIQKFVYDVTDGDTEITTEEAGLILTFLEQAGMKPPCLPEDYCQAILHVYYGGYSFNQWEEDVEKDAKVMAALERRSRGSDD